MLRIVMLPIVNIFIDLGIWDDCFNVRVNATKSDVGQNIKSLFLFYWLI